jgi:hypothetical protein
MSEDPKRLLFNRYSIPEATHAGTPPSPTQNDPLDVYDDDSVVQFDPVSLTPWPDKQGQAYKNPRGFRIREINNLHPPVSLGPFGIQLDRAYCCYTILTAKSDADRDEPPLGDQPPRALTAEERRDQLPQPGDFPLRGEGNDPHLYLFNVLVALEWEPHEADLRRLEWAFRRASDFLYDVTDGHMAFGQVVFGGPELMPYADIQIAASNRLRGRSWVGGIHDRDKNMPIRLGRGVWLNGFTIPWDEPEGYRTIIHEWGHYALHLKDAYLATQEVIFAQDAQVAGVHPQLLVRREQSDPDTRRVTIVGPKVQLRGDSIMESLEGTSELALRTRRQGTADGSYEWDTIREKYPLIPKGKNGSRQLLEGPGPLPLPLPLLVRQSGLGSGRKAFFTASDHTELFEREAPGVPYDRYWLYILKQPGTSDQQLLAQGTLDMRASYRPFQLLGAEAGDTFLAIIEDQEHRPKVFSGRIKQDNQHLEATLSKPAQEPPMPVVDVLPLLDPAEAAGGSIFLSINVRVRIDSTLQGLQPDDVWLFPLGGAPKQLKAANKTETLWESESCSLPGLDGHIMLRWGETRMITTFSHGGNPPTHTPGAPLPITAGSSDGNVLLFFDDPVFEDLESPAAEEKMEFYSRIRMITTINNGVQAWPPASEHGVARPWSYPFGIAANAPLPQAGLRATLDVRYRQPAERELLRGDVLICRLEVAGGTAQWVAKPTYTRPGSNSAALPLVPELHTADALFADPAGVEYYQLFWIPRAS